MRTPLFFTLRQLKPSMHRRGAVLRQFADTLGLAYLGRMDQHDDEYDAIRGFTASTSHRDAHYAVGAYDGQDIRIVDRFDIQKTHGKTRTPQSWVVLELPLSVRDMPHTFFIPTGKTAHAYERVFSTNIQMQPLNGLIHQKYSSALHEKYQILSKPTHAGRIEAYLTPPVIFGISEKLWPYGLELNDDRLYVYVSKHSITTDDISAALLAGMWLVGEIHGLAE